MIRILRIIQLLAFAAGLAVFGGAKEASGQHGDHSHHNQAKEKPTAQQQAQPQHAHGTKAGAKHDSADAVLNNIDKAAGLDKELPSVTLAQLEEIALENSSLLKQAGFAVKAAEGRRLQAGLLPNPIVGYAAEDLAFRNMSDSGRHSIFFEQQIPLGGKLAKDRRVAAAAIKRTEAEAEAYRAFVINNVRLLYYEALNAQHLVAIKRELFKNAQESLITSFELVNVGIDDVPDRLSAEIEEQKAEAEYFDAVADLEAVWQRLAAAIGKPELSLAKLLEDAVSDVADIDADAMLRSILEKSPEIKTAEADVERARAAVRRAKAEPAPDLYLRGGIGYSRERDLHSNTFRRVGGKGSLEIGISLPIFDRNRGGIAAAEAELAIAEKEVSRLRLELRSRFARELRAYRTAAFRAEKYRTQVLPRAKKAFEMYKANFDAMTAPYTEVLEARAAYLEAQEEYAENLMAMRRAMAILNGYVIAGKPGQLGGKGEAGEPAH